MATCWDTGEGTGHLFGETQAELSRDVQQEGSRSAVDLSSGTDRVQFTKQTPEGGRCYILAVKARPLSASAAAGPGRKDFTVTQFTYRGVTLSFW